MDNSLEPANVTPLKKREEPPPPQSGRETPLPLPPPPPQITTTVKRGRVDDGGEVSLLQRMIAQKRIKPDDVSISEQELRQSLNLLLLDAKSISFVNILKLWAMIDGRIEDTAQYVLVHCLEYAPGAWSKHEDDVGIVTTMVTYLYDVIVCKERGIRTVFIAVLVHAALIKYERLDLFTKAVGNSGNQHCLMELIRSKVSTA
jgi:hypothetical protein